MTIYTGKIPSKKEDDVKPLVPCAFLIDTKTVSSYPGLYVYYKILSKMFNLQNYYICRSLFKNVIYYVLLYTI